MRARRPRLVRSARIALLLKGALCKLASSPRAGFLTSAHAVSDALHTPRQAFVCSPEITRLTPFSRACAHSHD
eukprot:3070364-Pleurochrysis_carterae.AAC.1